LVGKMTSVLFPPLLRPKIFIYFEGNGIYFTVDIYLSNSHWDENHCAAFKNVLTVVKIGCNSIRYVDACRSQQIRYFINTDKCTYLHNFLTTKIKRM
jgi:hypothetical protein